MTCRGDKIVARFVLHENKRMDSHEGTCRCNMSPQHFLVCEVAVILPQLHVPATRPCLIFPVCVRNKILSLLYVVATCPCKLSPRVQPLLVRRPMLPIILFCIIYAISLRVVCYQGPRVTFRVLLHEVVSDTKQTCRPTSD